MSVPLIGCFADSYQVLISWQITLDAYARLGKVASQAISRVSSGETEGVCLEEHRTLVRESAKLDSSLV